MDGVTLVQDVTGVAVLVLAPPPDGEATYADLGVARVREAVLVRAERGDAAPPPRPPTRPYTVTHRLFCFFAGRY